MSATVSRKQLLEAIRTLGLDPDGITELHIFPEYLTGTQFVKNLDGTETKTGKFTMQSGEILKRDFHMQVRGGGANEPLVAELPQAHGPGTRYQLRRRPELHR